MKESKEYWQKSETQPTHWVKFFYQTKQGTHIYLVDKWFSFIPKGFAMGGAYSADSLAKAVIERVVKRAIFIGNSTTFTLGENFTALSRDMFRKTNDNQASIFWEAVIVGEFRHYLELSLRR